MTAVTLLPPLGVIAYTEHNLKQTRHAQIHDEALRSAIFAGSEVQRIFDGVENLLLALVHSPFVASHDELACKAYIDQLLPKVPHLRALGVADAKGYAWCGSGTGLSLADRNYFQDALGKPETLFMGNYSIGRASKVQVIPFGLKHAGTDAVAYGSLDLNWLSQKLLERGVPEGGSITLADRNGRMIARQPFPERFLGSQIPESYMRLVKADRPGTEQVMSQDGTPRVLGYIPVKWPPVDLYLSVGLNYNASYGKSEQMTRLAALIALASGCLALIAAWFAGDRMVVRPLSAIAATTSRWRNGDSAARTGLQDGSEFGVVAANLDRMMEELEKGRSQRELLTRELEHRVKNMLTTVQAIAGMSFKQSGAQPELGTFLARLRAVGDGYSAIRADQWQAAPLADVVDRALQPLGGRDNGRFTIDGPAVTLSSRQVLAVSMILHELGTNAVKYGALSTPEGRVAIRWNEDTGAVRLSWTETGGPAVTAPSTHGFGTRLIHAFGSELGHAELQYETGGLCCAVTMTM